VVWRRQTVDGFFFEGDRQFTSVGTWLEFICRFWRYVAEYSAHPDLWASSARAVESLAIGKGRAFFLGTRCVACVGCNCGLTKREGHRCLASKSGIDDHIETALADPTID